MDIDILSLIIEDLLVDNDRIGLPGIGDFVSEIMPATFSDKGYTINPPYRKIFFRKGSCSNDLIAQRYASENNLPEEEAKEIINAFVGEMGEVLLDKKVIIFPGLGRLRATKENHIFFVADENLKQHPADTALEAISLKSKGEVVHDDPIPSEYEDTLPEEKVEEKSFSPKPVPNQNLSYGNSSFKSDSNNGHKKFETLIIILLYAVLLFVIFAAIFFILSRVFPDFTDRLLYNKEQLEILNYWKQ